MVRSAQFVTYDGQTYYYNCPGQFSLSNIATSSFQFSAEILVDSFATSFAGIQGTGVTAISLTTSNAATIQIQGSSIGTLQFLINRVDVSTLILRLSTSAVGDSLADCLAWGISCVRGDPRQLVLSEQPPGISASTNVSIIMYSTMSYRIIFATGIMVDVSVQESLSTLGISLSVPRKYQGQTISGLLGNCDGNSGNEFSWVGGLLPAPLSLTDAFNRWCKQCKYIIDLNVRIKDYTLTMKGTVSGLAMKNESDIKASIKKWLL